MMYRIWLALFIILPLCGYNYHRLAPPRKSADRTVPALWLISPVGTTFVVSRTISSFNPLSLNLAYHILHLYGLQVVQILQFHSKITPEMIQNFPWGGGGGGVHAPRPS